MKGKKSLNKYEQTTFVWFLKSPWRPVESVLSVSLPCFYKVLKLYF